MAVIILLLVLAYIAYQWYTWTKKASDAVTAPLKEATEIVAEHPLATATVLNPLGGAVFAATAYPQETKIVTETALLNPLGAVAGLYEQFFGGKQP